MNKLITFLLIIIFMNCTQKSPAGNEEPLNIYDMERVVAYYYTKDKPDIPYVIGAILYGEAMGTVEEYSNYVIVEGIYLYSSGYFVFSGRIDTMIYIVENIKEDTLRDVDGIMFEKNKIIIRVEEELNLEARYPRSVYIYSNIINKNNKE